jgi:hypothetical protein
MLEAMQVQTTCEHPTPQGILKATRKVFAAGKVLLDVASSSEMNQYVQADRIFTKTENGLAQNWVSENVFLNPPGSQRPKDQPKIKGQPRLPSALAWLDKLVLHFERGDISEAIYIGYNGPETLSKRPQHCRIASGVIHSSTEHTCVEKEDGMTGNGRIKFLGDRPFFPSVILYFGSNDIRFLSEFIKFGTAIIIP